MVEFKRIFLVLLLLSILPVKGHAWWDSNWYSRRQIIINNTGNPNLLTDYQIELNISYDPDMLPDFGDLRFVYNKTEIPYWFEMVVPSSYAIVWIRVPTIKAGSYQKIYMYYGNPTARSKSNGTAVFLFFDDMEKWEGWVNYGNGIVSQDSTRAYEGNYSAHKTDYNSPNGALKSFPEALSRDIIVESWINRNSNYAGGPLDRIGVVDDNGNGYSSSTNPEGTGLRVEVITGMNIDYYNATYNVSIPMDDWYLQRLIIESSGIVSVQLEYPRGEVVASVSINDTNYSSFTNYYIDGGYDFWVDLVRIRKFADKEPTYSIGMKENIGRTAKRCVNNTLTMYTEKVVCNNLNCSKEVEMESVYCPYGCDPVQNQCSPPPYVAYGIVIALLLFIMIIIYLSRRV